MKTLLIDGDWLCYSIACAAEEPNPFDTSKQFFDYNSAIKTITFKVNSASYDLNCSNVKFYFSCKREDNWRKLILPSYKENRNNVTPPIGLYQLIEFVKKNYDFVEENRLEADDLIGIDATGRYRNKCIVYSIDKDFLTLPAIIYNPNKKIIKRQTKKGAILCFLYQTIIGDSSDGYRGINKIGPKKAEAFLSEHENNICGIWEHLCELAERQGHDESYLLIQARMAHILHNCDYNSETKEVTLWSPNILQE